MANPKKKSDKQGDGTIALNKKSRFDYFIEERLEAGIALQGWEVKSLRAGKVQISESYVLLKDGEAFLFGALITPLITASTHVETDARRTRKLLLHRQEIAKLIGAVERKGYTVVTTAMYWKHGHVKVEIGLAKGKKEHDKRDTEKARDWSRERNRMLKRG